MEKTAKCSCGNLEIKINGKPEIIAACSCNSCQVRTGSAFAVNSYFKVENIESKSGTSKEFEHFSDEGKSIVRSFCTECGSTVFWKAELLPGYVGIAVGCFGDPNFPEPKISVWNKSKYDWVTFPDHWVHADDQDVTGGKTNIKIVAPLEKNAPELN